MSYFFNKKCNNSAAHCFQGTMSIKWNHMNSYEFIKITFFSHELIHDFLNSKIENFLKFPLVEFLWNHSIFKLRLNKTKNTFFSSKISKYLK